MYFDQANDSIYFGDFHQDQMSGYGCKVLDTAERYEGVFENGAFHG